MIIQLSDTDMRHFVSMCYIDAFEAIVYRVPGILVGAERWTYQLIIADSPKLARHMSLIIPKQS